MKIIELLNLKYNKKIKDGFKFIYNDLVYIYKEKQDRFLSRSKSLFSSDIYIELWLEKEIIIVTPELIETDETEEEFEDIAPLKLENFSDSYEEMICNKIDELIDQVNKMNKKLEEKNEK